MPTVGKKMGNSVVDFGGYVVDEIKKMVDEGWQRSVWHTISALPKDAYFESQTEKEKVLLLMRAHPATNLWWIAIVAMLIGVPMFWSEFPLLSSVNPLTQFFITILWYMGLALFSVQNALLWFYNVYIITDERVVDVDFFGLLYKNINATQIRKIEDVNYSQKGLLAGFLNYGNIVIETASAQKSDDTPSERSAFTFDAVPNPDRVARVLTELMEQEEKEEYEGRTH